jgi:site-specific recombinase XerD
MASDDDTLPAASSPAALVQAGLAAIAAGEAALGAELMDRARVSTRRRLAEQAADYARHARRDATKTAYRSDIAHFEAWCRAHGFAPMPAAPETIGLYLADHAETLKVATLRRRLAAIAAAHNIAQHPINRRHPAIYEVWRGILNTHGAVRQPKKALLADQLIEILAGLPTALASRNVLLAAKRDRALLLIGFAGALRRSELVGLDAAEPPSKVASPGEGDFRPGTPDDPWHRGWIERNEGGLVLQLRRTKGDRDGEGEAIAIPFGKHPGSCAVAAWDAWRVAAGLETGPAFRPITRTGVVLERRLRDREVARIVKRRAAAAGLDPAEFAGHSLRSGHATTAYLNDVDEAWIQRQLRHKSPGMTRQYNRMPICWGRAVPANWDFEASRAFSLGGKRLQGPFSAYEALLSWQARYGTMASVVAPMRTGNRAITATLRARSPCPNSAPRCGWRSRRSIEQFLHIRSTASSVRAASAANASNFT